MVSQPRCTRPLHLSRWVLLLYSPRRLPQARDVCWLWGRQHQQLGQVSSFHDLICNHALCVISIACRLCSVCLHRCPLIVFCPPQCVGTACARRRSAAWRVVARAAPKTAPCPSLCVPSPVLACAVVAACVPPPSGVVCVFATPATLAARVTRVPGASASSAGRALQRLPFQSCSPPVRGFRPRCRV